MQNVRTAPKPPGFIEAVVDPVINALTCAAGVARFSQTGTVRSGRQQLVRFALQNGPAQLTAPQKIRLLSDPLALSQLHLDVWTSPESHALWRDAIASRGIVGETIERPPQTHAREPVRSAAGA
jgi:membrane glycosyltransferase